MWLWKVLFISKFNFCQGNNNFFLCFFFFFQSPRVKEPVQNSEVSFKCKLLPKMMTSCYFYYKERVFISLWKQYCVNEKLVSGWAVLENLHRKLIIGNLMLRGHSKICLVHIFSTSLAVTKVCKMNWWQEESKQKNGVLIALKNLKVY